MGKRGAIPPQCRYCKVRKPTLLINPLQGTFEQKYIGKELINLSRTKGFFIFRPPSFA